MKTLPALFAPATAESRDEAGGLESDRGWGGRRTTHTSSTASFSLPLAQALDTSSDCPKEVVEEEPRTRLQAPFLCILPQVQGSPWNHLWGRSGGRDAEVVPFSTWRRTRVETQKLWFKQMLRLSCQALSLLENKSRSMPWAGIKFLCSEVIEP